MNRPLVLSCLFFLGFASPARAADESSFFRIREIIEQWTPDQHLWTSGQLGVRQDRLAELEAWLDEKAPNWTVVLMQSAKGQSHDGRSGMDAVEFALGEGLSNETGFGKLVDARTGESNGAVFVLFLEERKFSYFASDVYDQRNLGERYWVGRLDAPAIQAMRNGGRVVDAVKNTITSIDSSLSRKLTQEAEQKRVAELERQKAIAEARTYAGRLEGRIRETESRLATFAAAHPAVTGPLASPDLATWRADVPFIDGLVSSGDLAKARKEFVATGSAIDAFHRGLDLWEEDLSRFDPLAEAIAGHPAPAGARLVAGRLAFATDALKSARENHATGDPLYASQLQEATDALADASRHLTEWKEAEARRKALTKALLVIALLLVLVVLFITNRMRRPAKNEAVALFGNWKEQLRGRFDELFQLMDRVGMVVGSSRDLDERGYAGTTEQLAREAIKTVDELFIMSSATDRVMAEASHLILPRSPIARLINAFSSRRYRRGVNRLGGEPIGFDDRDGLAFLLGLPDTDEKKRQSRSLLGRIEDYEPFKLSFAQLIEAYDSPPASTGFPRRSRISPRPSRNSTTAPTRFRSSRPRIASSRSSPCGPCSSRRRRNVSPSSPISAKPIPSRVLKPFCPKPRVSSRNRASSSMASRTFARTISRASLQAVPGCVNSAAPPPGWRKDSVPSFADPKKSPGRLPIAASRTRSSPSTTISPASPVVPSPASSFPSAPVSPSPHV